MNTVQVQELIKNEQELRAALNQHYNNKVKRSKFDYSTKQLRSFYRQFTNSLLVINETPYSWIVKTKRYGTINISKEYSIRSGLFIKWIDTWYLKNVLASKTVKGVQLKSMLWGLSTNPVR